MKIKYNYKVLNFSLNKAENNIFFVKQLQYTIF